MRSLLCMSTDTYTYAHIRSGNLFCQWVSRLWKPFKTNKSLGWLEIRTENIHTYIVCVKRWLTAKSGTGRYSLKTYRQFAIQSDRCEKVSGVFLAKDYYWRTIVVKILLTFWWWGKQQKMCITLTGSQVIRKLFSQSLASVVGLEVMHISRTESECFTRSLESWKAIA